MQSPTCHEAFHVDITGDGSELSQVRSRIHLLVQQSRVAPRQFPSEASGTSTEYEEQTRDLLHSMVLHLFLRHNTTLSHV